MNSVIDFTLSRRTAIPCINDEEANAFLKKGWSLSSTYYFSEIRDVYLALTLKQFENINKFTEFCNHIRLPYVRSRWEPRRVLEHLNALINFSLVKKNYTIARKVFENSKIGDHITEEDKKVFREIYFSFFRFKEVFSWFVDLNPIRRLDLVKTLERSDIEASSRPLFAFAEAGRFHDTFFYELNSNEPLYYLRHKMANASEKSPPGNEDLMRFWDLFIKWGTELSVLEKFSLRDLGIRTSSNKSIICCYVIQEYPIKFDLLDFVTRNFGNTRYIYLPQLVFEIARAHKLSIERAQELIIMEYKSRRKYFSFERTSEIFVRASEIKDRDKILFPKYNDSFVSHLMVR